MGDCLVAMVVCLGCRICDLLLDWCSCLISLFLFAVVVFDLYLLEVWVVATVGCMMVAGFAF